MHLLNLIVTLCAHSQISYSLRLFTLRCILFSLHTYCNYLSDVTLSVLVGMSKMWTISLRNCDDEGYVLGDNLSLFIIRFHIIKQMFNVNVSMLTCSQCNVNHLSLM